MTNWQAFDRATGKELTKGDKVSNGHTFDSVNSDGSTVMLSEENGETIRHVGFNSRFVDVRRNAGTIDLTPSWRGVLPVYIAALESGTATGRSAAIVELQRMADLADLYIAKMREGFPVK